MAIEKTASYSAQKKYVMDILQSCYDLSRNGIPKVDKPVKDLVQDYLDKYKDKETATKVLVRNQIIKCTTSGFLTGLGGLITLPVAIPANVSSVLYMQMRMIEAIALMNDYDLKNDETQTFVYACLAGVSVNSLLKQATIKFGSKLSNNLIKKIPGKVLTSINQKVGFRFVTKFGQTGVINIAKLVPGVGGVVGGGFDLIETRMIANRAYNWFAKGDLSDDKLTKSSLDKENTFDLEEVNSEDLPLDPEI